MAGLRKDNAAPHDAVPDLMASSSSLSVGDTSKSQESKNNESFYHSCNSSFYSKDNSTSIANVHPAFLNSAFFRKKQSKAATHIQAVFRGFLTRFVALKKPLLLELDDVYKRKEEELERIEIQKHDLKNQFRKEIKSKLQTLEQIAEDHNGEIEYLKRETAKYKEQNGKLEICCKQLKKANKRLKKDVKKNEMHGKLIEVRKEVASLQIWNTSAKGEVQKYVAALDHVLNRLERIEEKCDLETGQKMRTHDCICDIINTVDCRDGALAKQLRKILKNGVDTKTK